MSLAAVALGVAGYLVGGELKSQSGAKGESDDSAAARKSVRSSAAQRTARSGIGAEELSRGDLVALSEADRLAYFLERYRRDPAAAIREALRLEYGGDYPRTLEPYSQWMLAMLASEDAEMARKLIAESDLTHPEIESLTQAVGVSERRKGNPRERLDKALNGPQWASSLDAPPLLAELAKSDPAAAMNYFERFLKERPEAIGTTQRVSVLTELAKADPRRFAQLFEEVKMVGLKGNMRLALARTLGESQPLEALALLDDLAPNSRTRALTSIMLATGWGQSDPQAAVEWAKSELGGITQLYAIAGALPRAYVQENPQQVLAWFAGSSALEHLEHFSQQRNPFDFQNVSTREGTARTAGFSVDELSGVREVYSQAVLALAEQDPQDAMGYVVTLNAARMSPFDRQGPLSGRIMGLWTDRDALGALRWLGEQDRKLQQSVAQSDTVISALQTLDPAQRREAALLVGEFGQGVERQYLNAIMEGFTEDPATLVGFADGLPEEMRGMAQGPMMDVLVKQDPVRAEGELGRFEGRALREYETRIAQELALIDPQQALEFAERVPQERRTTETYQPILRAWAERDWPAAREWYEDLPAGPEQSLSAEFMEVQRYQRDNADPVAAWDTLLGMESHEGLRQLVSYWGQRDRAAASQAVEGSTLTEERKDLLRQRLPKEEQP